MSLVWWGERRGVEENWWGQTCVGFEFESKGEKELRERIFKFKLRNGNFLTKERLRKRKKNSRKSDKNMSGKKWKCTTARNALANNRKIRRRCHEREEDVACHGPCGQWHKFAGSDTCHIQIDDCLVMQVGDPHLPYVWYYRIARGIKTT